MEPNSCAKYVTMYSRVFGMMIAVPCGRQVCAWGRCRQHLLMRLLFISTLVTGALVCIF